MNGIRKGLLCGLALSLVIVACRDGDSADISTTEAAPVAGPTTFDVTAIDFAYGDLPTTIKTGDSLTLINKSETELHEIVALRLPEDETRSARELLEDPELLGAIDPSTVVLAPPGGGSFAAVGDGSFALPGRYLLFCGIPTGADPDEYLAAAAAAPGPPQVEGGPPHFISGMFGEITVAQ